MDSERIFSAEQIKVHPDLPNILKQYTKAVIRSKLTDRDEIIAFSYQYFLDMKSTENDSQ